MGGAPGGGRLRAWLEVLRAPLLLSPVADVLAGWAFAAGTAGRVHWIGSAPMQATPRDLVLAVVAGVCLLAAGMAQNAVVDLEDDRLRKPQRPLARGALGKAPVACVAAALWLIALAAAAAVTRGLLVTATLIVVGTNAYHLALKRWRVPGCLLLGLLRGLDLRLGVLVVVPTVDAGRALSGLVDSPFADATWWYAAYAFAAALFASTDDEPEDSRRGLASSPLVAQILLALGIGLALARLRHAQPWVAVAVSAALLSWALVRIRAATALGSQRLSGAMLSNFYLVTGAIAAGTGPWPGGLLVAALAVLLLLASRQLMRIVPPT